MKRDTFNKILLNIDTTYYQNINKKSKKSNIIYPFYLVIAGIVIFQLLFSYDYTYFGTSFTVNGSTILNTFSIVIVFALIALAFGCIFLKPKSINKLLFALSFIQILLFILNYLFNRFLMNDILFLPTVSITGLYLGFLVSSIIFLTFYALDSKQRINSFCLIAIFIFIFAFIRLFVVNVSNGFVNFALPLSCMIILLYIMPFLGKSYFTEFALNDEKNPISPLVVLFILLVLVLFNEVFFTSLRNSFGLENWTSLSTNLLIGLLISIVLCRILYSITNYSNYGYIFLWLSLAILTYQMCLFHYFINIETYKIVIPIFMGMTTGAGLISIFMILGNILYDKASLRFIRWSGSIAAVIIAIFLSFNDIFIGFSPLNLLVVGQTIAFVNLFIWIIFVMVIFLNRQSNQIEAINNELSDDVEAIIIDTKYPNPYEVLTNKEIIVFEQLLLGNTLRQIAGELHMKYDTVNFHYKNIYRKLEVNSRIELIVRYGKK